MVTILHSTQKSWNGPWLLDGVSIKELDNIISTYWEKLERRRKSLLEKDIKERYKSYKKIYGNTLPDHIKETLELHTSESSFALTDKQFNIILSRDHARFFPCESFGTAFRERALLDEIPCGFAVYLTSGDVTCKLFVDYDTNKLEVEIKPNDVAESRELFTDVYTWVDRHSQTPIQRFFEWLSRRKWFLIVPYTSTMFLLFVQAQDRTMENLRDKAIDFLQTGISQSNVIEAVDILLRIETQSVTPQPMHFPTWFWFSLGGLTYLVLALFLQPRVILGIGKGTRRIKLWKWWQGILLITIPLFIVGLLSSFFGERILQSMFP
jgi:hypothetical protein